MTAPDTADPANTERTIQPHRSHAEVRARAEIASLLQSSPIPHQELPSNLSLYLRREVLADLLVMSELYRRILDVPGVVMEFGTRWGRRLGLLVTLRELYEPYDYIRKVVGFDTFDGFPDVHEKDGSYAEIRPGAMAVPNGYDEHLRLVLETHERESMNAHIRRFDLRRGDVRHTLPEYLRAHPETIISLAYFDLDLYEPTRACLELVRPHLVPGSVLAFDQLAHPNFPGETQALLETLDLGHATMQKLPHGRYPTILTV